MLHATGGDPWEDEKWKGYKWTVYRGTAYDLTPYLARHPGGRWLLNLAIGRDCTALFESYHLRPDVAAGMLKRLPVLADFPVNAVPRSPYPNDSDIYNTIRCGLERLSPHALILSMKHTCLLSASTSPLH